MKKYSLLFPVLLLVFLFEPFSLAIEKKVPGQISNIDYEIWVELDDQNKMLSGKEEIRWLNRTQDAVNDMWFHLYWNAFKNELSTMMQESKEETIFGIKVKDGEWGWIDVTGIELADGRDLKPAMEFIVPDEPSHPDDQTVMRVRFPEPVKPGEEVHLLLQFRSKIPRTILRSGYYRSYYFIAQWFPKPGVYEEGKGWNCHQYHLNSEFFADFANFRVHITVPKNFVVAASGIETQVTKDEARHMTTYTFEQANIHDFAWTAAPHFIKVERDFIADREVSQEEYENTARKLGLPVEEVKLPDVRMILLIEPQHKNQIERHFKALSAAIKYYGLWYGPYPYETVTMVDPPFRTGSGGMEYPTLFTAGTSILRTKKVLSPEGVIVHEFGHGYWYGLVANNEFEEAWLDEGLNTYSTGKVLQKAYGPGVLPLNFKGIPLAFIPGLPRYYDYELDRAASIQIVKIDPIVNFSWHFLNRMSYALNVYQRVSMSLNTLERLVGEETMLRIMRTYHMRFRFRHPKTKDFIDTVNEVTGKDFSWFFKEYFMNTMNFDYGISSLRSFEKPALSRGVFDRTAEKEEVTQKKARELEAKKKKGKEKEKLYLTRITLMRYGEAKVNEDTPLKLKVVFEDGSEEIRFWDGQKRWAKFFFEKPSKAKYGHLDPDTLWLIDSNLTNNSFQVRPSRSGIFGLTVRILFWAQSYFRFLSILS